MKISSGLLASITLAFLFAGTGCANKTTAERDALNQNQTLKEQLEAERAARQAAEARANAVTAQATTMPGEVQPPTMEGGAMDASASPIGAAPRTGRNSAPDIGGVSSSTNSRGEVVLAIAGETLFDSGKAALKPAAKKTLDSIAASLKSKYAGQQIRVEGHTDPSPVKGSGWDDNWDLGAARARSVMLYLSEKGVKNMYIASFAATEPKGKTAAANRRVEIVVVKK